jgi:LysW-gamma-L-lysine carboxypeptidase
MHQSTDDGRIKFLLDVVSTYSPSGNEERVAGLLLERLVSQGLDAELDATGNVFSTVGDGQAVVLLCGHMDTVEGWIEPRFVDQTVYGRGAVDAKGALLSLMYAFEDCARLMERSEDLRDNLKVVFSGVVQEEGDSSGIKALIQKGLRAEAAVFGEPSGPNRIAVGYRGHIPLDITFVTPEAHASAPWLTTNSIEVAYRFYEDLKSMWRCDSPQRVNCVSVALTGINAGTHHNVVPGRTHVKVDIRVPVGTSTGIVRRTVEQLITQYTERGVNVEYVFGEPTEPYRVSPRSGVLRSLTRAIIKLGYGTPIYIMKSGTGDMNTYSHSVGAECVAYGPGDPRLSHTRDEHVDLREVFSCSEVVVNALKEYAQLCTKTHVDTQ